MATPQTDIQSRAIELAADAMDTFCEDISSMFGVPMDANQEQAVPSTVKGLKKDYKRLAAVYSVKSRGVMEGPFHLIFDKEGMFTLAGLIVMQPEARIKENRTAGTASEAEGLSDAIREVGNLMIGSWDRMFREGMDGHGHFVQSNTYIGNACGESEEAIGLSDDREFLFSPFEMTVGTYPAFNCGVIFPTDIFGTDAQERPTSPDPAQAAARPDEEASDEPESIDDVEQPTADVTGEPPAEPAPVEKQQSPQGEDEIEVIEDPDETDAQAQASSLPGSAPANSEQAHKSPEDSSAAGPDSTEDERPDSTGDDSAPETSRPAGAADVDLKQVDEIEEQATTAGPQQLISETIQKMTQSPAILPGEHPTASLHMQAVDVMCADIAWGSADDTVEQALTKMQQYDAGYMLVGQDGKIEGIVSRSDLAGAISPYLKPTFTKWRRPLDDATLQLKIKWIMTRPVRTVKPETTLATVMEQMCRSGGRCLPVIDKQGQALGLITVFDIFKALLEQDSNISIEGRTPQAPPLV